MSNVEQWEHDEQRAMETEITTLRDQVKQLKAELKSIDGALDDPRANLTLTTSEIIWELKEQVEKLTKERDELKTVPMKYRRMQFNAELQAERETMEPVLAALGDIAGTSSSTRIRRVALGAMAMIRERMRDAASSS